jgi:hypothetical protein
MRILAPTAVAILLGLLGCCGAAASPCPDLLQMGQAAAERINLIQAEHDRQREHVISAQDRSHARNEAARLTAELERAHAKLKQVVAAARDAGCEGIDPIVEAESQSEENLQGARAELAEMSQPDATGAVNGR